MSALDWLVFSVALAGASVVAALFGVKTFIESYPLAALGVAALGGVGFYHGIRYWIRRRQSRLNQATSKLYGYDFKTGKHPQRWLPDADDPDAAPSYLPVQQKLAVTSGKKNPANGPFRPVDIWVSCTPTSVQESAEPKGIRIHELAKEQQVDAGELQKKITGWGLPTKSISSILPPMMADQVRELLQEERRPFDPLYDTIDITEPVNPIYDEIREAA